MTVQAGPDGRRTPPGAVALPRARHRLSYAALLVVVAPFLAETVASANTPAVVFPILLPLYVVLYGLPALLLREAWVRGRIGWPAVIALGVAYTALNEGLVAGTWFKLGPVDGKVLAFTAEQAGHSGGVNWAPAVGLVVFHTVYSLVVPTVLVEAWAVPARGAPWLRRPGLWIASALVVFVALGSLTPKATTRTCAGPACDTCVAGRWAATALLVGLVLLAAALPRWRPSPRSERRVPGDKGLVAAGVAFGLVFFAAFFVLPLAGLPAVAVVAHVLLLAVGAVMLVRWMSSAAWSLRAGALLATGALIPGMLSSLAHITVLQPIAAVVAGFLLWTLFRRLGRVRSPDTRCSRSS